jgi:hypothetical protein
MRLALAEADKRANDARFARTGATGYSEVLKAEEEEA